jgi:hypothetical protein
VTDIEKTRQELMKNGRQSLFLVALLFCSCAQDVANRYYATQTYPPKNPRNTELLFHAPSRPFTVIADLQSRGESPNGMRKRAAQIGADAVIVTPLGGFYKRADEWATADSMSDTYSRLVGSAIKYTN